MEAALEPGREQEGAGNFPFPVQALGAEGADRWRTKGVTRPERVGQGRVRKGHWNSSGWGAGRWNGANLRVEAEPASWRARAVF